MVRNTLIPISALERRGAEVRVISELLAGRPFDLQSDLDLVKDIDPVFLEHALKRPGFKAQYDADVKRNKHMNLFSTMLTITTGSNFIAPPILENSPINKAELKPLCISLSYTVGISIASRLTGVAESTVTNWLYEDAGSSSSYKENFMKTIAGKSMHIVDAYLDRLLDKRLLENSSIKDVKEILTIMTGTAKDVLTGEWADAKIKNASMISASSGASINNVVNVIVNDKSMHEGAVNNIMMKMGLIDQPLCVEGPEENIKLLQNPVQEDDFIDVQAHAYAEDAAAELAEINTNDYVEEINPLHTHSDSVDNKSIIENAYTSNKTTS